VPELILPRSVELAIAAEQRGGGVLIDNRTDLPDHVVQDAVETFFVENASLAGASAANTFQTYASEGSLLARSRFRTPANVYDEIKLSRDLADRDDDVRAVIGLMIATAFSDGMENHHPDEKTVTLFNGLAAYMNLDGVFKRMYREYLIAQQVTTVSLFTRRQAVDVGEGDTEAMVAPLIGVLLSERVRTIGTDLFGNAELAYIPEPKLERWLSEYFDEKTTPARKAELRRQDPVSAVMFTGKVQVDAKADMTGVPIEAYRLNPRMCHRTKAPCDGDTPRPLMTANFALLEAKRLLNLMDFALLQGGMNFIVVAKKGTDERPALQPEIENLKQVVRTASRTGVIVGDHRLTFEIITPDLTSLLDKSKRTLLGRKIAMTLMRLPETSEDSGGSGAATEAELEFISRVISSDRADLRRHVENYIYEEAAKRNNALSNGTPRVWFPKIVLQGTQYFTDYVLKLRDRGDIPRKTAVEAAGFDWEAGVAQRKRELAENIDETMMPAAVPFSNPTAGPQDNNSGRPTGTSPDNGRPGAKQGAGRDNVRQLRTVNRNAGETIRAVLDLDEVTGEQVTRRVGERTYAILEQYPDRSVGRMTALERDALTGGRPLRAGPVAVIPVNPGYEVGDLRAVRLAAGLSVLVGTRKDDAIVAKALCFREPEFSLLDAEETALRWGFPIEGWATDEEELALLDPPKPELPPGPTVVVNPAAAPAGGRVRKIVHRDENGNISEIEEIVEPAKPEGGGE
jgi:hypothetical protein